MEGSLGGQGIAHKLYEDVSNRVQAGWLKWRAATGVLRDKKFRSRLKRMLRWMCSKTMKDRIRNHVFREKLGIAPLSAKMRENKLRWFGHMQRKTHDAPVRRTECIIVEGKKNRGKPRRTWEEQIISDLHELHLSMDLTRDRASWRRLIHVLD